MSTKCHVYKKRSKSIRVSQHAICTPGLLLIVHYIIRMAVLLFLHRAVHSDSGPVNGVQSQRESREREDQMRAKEARYARTNLKWQPISDL